jgi:uncharacterized membrane protein HdeD (DUF308 family)
LNGWIWLIIIMVLGIIIGNILLLKQSANMRLPKVTKDNNKKWDEEDD